MSPDSLRYDPLVQQTTVIIPEFTINELLNVIPSHCFKRSASKSSLYMFWDLLVIACIYKTAAFLDSFIDPAYLSLPFPYLYSFASFSIWSLYGFGAGLFGMGLWVIAHECGHQAFSESKLLNNSVGWVLHSALGVPYHSWRITHAAHHASTCHMDQDQVFVPWTRSDYSLPPLDPARDDLFGSKPSVSNEVKKELWEALGDSPIGASLTCAIYLISGLPMYFLFNTAGQLKYPKGTNHFNPSSIIFSPKQRADVVLSDAGILIWLFVLVTWVYTNGFSQVFRLYLVPFLWVNHWLVLITFLQHTDPLVPHYRAPAFTFPRGALSTLDRSLLGDCGSIMAWLGAHATNGISETHVLHHVTSRIPHYNAWEAADALRAKLAENGIVLQGAPGGWREVYRVLRECKFVEDQGSIVFYKNAYGVAAARPGFTSKITESDSGVELDI